MGRLHNEELRSLYRSPYIVRVIESRRLTWAVRVARMEEGRSAFKTTGKRPDEYVAWRTFRTSMEYDDETRLHLLTTSKSY